MDSLTKTIGKNIRELRRGKQMTQSELAGDGITRNMLSLIESGSASPSISTLAYLAERLDVPVGYFFTMNDAESSVLVKFEIIENIRALFTNHEYEKCVQLCRSTSMIDDEIAYILAESELTLAYEEAKRYHLASAGEHLSLALAASELTSYDQLGISQTVDFAGRLIASATADTIDAALVQPYKYSHSRIPAELFVFLFRLKMIEDGKAPAHELDALMPSPIYRDYIMAKELLASGDRITAIPLLRKVRENPDTDFFVEYRACCDLEECSNALEDYKSAYTYSKKKMELIERFKR